MVGPCFYVEELVGGSRTLRRQIRENSFPAYGQSSELLEELLRNYDGKSFLCNSGWTGSFLYPHSLKLSIRFGNMESGPFCLCC